MKVGVYMKNQKHLSLRIDDDMLVKFRYVCRYEGRSANSQLNIYIRNLVTAYEKEHGEIIPENDNEN